MLIRVLSLDPGVTTGWCRADLEDSFVSLLPGQGELSHRQIYSLLATYEPHYVVCEDFEYRPGQAKDYIVLTSLEYIGVVKLYAEPSSTRMWIQPKLSMQKAAEGKGYYSNDKLKELGVYKRGLPHGMDALRHMLHWFTFKAGYGLTDGKAQFKLYEGN